MDGDDIMHSKRLEKQVEFLSQNTSIGLIASRLNTFRLLPIMKERGIVYMLNGRTLLLLMSLIQQIGLLTAHLHIHLQPSGKN